MAQANPANMVVNVQRLMALPPGVWFFRATTQPRTSLTEAPQVQSLFWEEAMSVINLLCLRLRLKFI
jgi:hypothetical protein